MGVSYTPILGVGLQFETAGEVVDFLHTAKHVIISDELYDQLVDEGDSYIQELAYDKLLQGFHAECLNSYSGYEYFVGIKLGVRDVNEFGNNYAKAILHWNEYFPDTEPELVHTVSIS